MLIAVSSDDDDNGNSVYGFILSYNARNFVLGGVHICQWNIISYNGNNDN